MKRKQRTRHNHHVKSTETHKHAGYGVRLLHQQKISKRISSKPVVNFEALRSHLHPKARVYASIQRLLNRQVGKAMKNDHEKEVPGQHQGTSECDTFLLHIQRATHNTTTHMDARSQKRDREWRVPDRWRERRRNNTDRDDEKHAQGEVRVAHMQRQMQPVSSRGEAFDAKSLLHT